MKLDSLRPLLDHPGPLTTVCLDVTRADEAGEREVRSRWSGLRRELEQQGAPADTLERIGERVMTPTHVPGPHGRFVVADATTILFDRVLADAPPREEAVHDGVPALVPAARAECEAVRYLLVEVDRSGADLTWSGTDAHGETNDRVEGGHDVLHKVRAGGWSHRRMQSRARDSWERNAEAVAAELDRAVAKHRPELVMLTGDVRAMALIRDEVARPTAEILVEVPGGSRADGVKEDAFVRNVHRVLEAYRARRRDDVVTQLSEGIGRGEQAVTELADVAEVLRRGQVAELVLVQDAAGTLASLDGRTLWAGPDPMQLAVRRSELADLGVADGEVRELRAELALLRAAVAQDAGITFADAESLDVVDGVGALLRWHDPSTPHENAPSYTADAGRKGR